MILFFLNLLLCLFLAMPAHAEGSSRFFLSGDGHIKIKSLKNGKTLDARFLQVSGDVDPEVMKKIDAVFGFPTTQKGENISWRLISYLDYFSDQVDQNGWIELNSGYRSPKYNKGLRDQGRTVARTSTHIDGMALDFKMSGMNAEKLWHDIRGHECCGAGFYHGKTIHLDSGRPRFWTTSTSKVKTNASAYNRYAFVSADYDRYHPGETMRISFTSISDFGFGVSQKIKLIDQNRPKKKVTLKLKGVAPCQKIQKHKDARFLYVDLPKSIKPGLYKIDMSYCEKVHEEMPDSPHSATIEILTQNPQ